MDAKQEQEQAIRSRSSIQAQKTSRCSYPASAPASGYFFLLLLAGDSDPGIIQH